MLIGIWNRMRTPRIDFGGSNTKKLKTKLASKHLEWTHCLANDDVIWTLRKWIIGYCWCTSYHFWNAVSKYWAWACHSHFGWTMIGNFESCLQIIIWHFHFERNVISTHQHYWHTTSSTHETTKWKHLFILTQILLIGENISTAMVLSFWRQHLFSNKRLGQRANIDAGQLQIHRTNEIGMGKNRAKSKSYPCTTILHARSLWTEHRLQVCHM